MTTIWLWTAWRGRRAQGDEAGQGQRLGAPAALQFDQMKVEVVLPALIDALTLPALALK
jgi:hypothetical protein